jgi:hypothetical protein
MPHTSQEIKLLLEQAFQQLKRAQRYTSFLGIALLFFAWICVFILIEEVAYFSVLSKVILLSLLIILSVYLWFRSQRTKLSQTFSEFYIHFSQRSKLPEVSYALDLAEDKNANPKLVEAAILSNLKQVEQERLSDSLSTYLKSSSAHKSLITRLRALAGTSLVFFLIVFNFTDAAGRLGNFWTTYSPPNPYSYQISPGITTIEQGTDFKVSATFAGKLPEEVVLLLKTSIEQDYRSRGMELQNGTFSSADFPLNNDITYYVEMDGFISETFTASVQLRPRFTELNIEIQPPSYTKLNSTNYTYPFSRIDAYEGSRITINGIVNKKLDSLQLNSTLGNKTLAVDSTRFQFDAEITQRDTIQFELIDQSNLTNENPFEFIISPLEDKWPIVEILEPSKSIESIAPDSLPLIYRASDDFGLTAASLRYELSRAFVETPITGNIRLDRPTSNVLDTFNWGLTELDLKPKDELTFWIVVTDNDGYNGFKSSESQKVTLTVPSLVDYFDGLSEREDDVQTDLEDLSESFENIESGYEEFKEQLKDNPQPGYEEERQLEQVKQQQEEIQEKVKELNEKFEEIKEELNENSLLSEETLEAYNELQELMEQIDDPDFREALEKLQENMQRMTPEQLRRAMEETEFNEELYKQRIERTLELFKQLKLNSDLEKLAKSYDDLARQEEDLESNEKTGEDIAQQTESTQEQIEQLKDQIDDLDENTTKKTEKTVQELSEFSKEKLEEIKKQLEERLKALENESQEARESENSEGSKEQDQDSNQQEQPQNNPQQNQKSPKKQFEELAEKTRQSMQQMNQQQQQVNIAGLQYVLYSLLTLSDEQEDLVSYASTTENRSQAYVGYARDQKNVEQIFGAVSDSLTQLSKEIPQLSNRINKNKLEVERQLTRSLEQMAERNQNAASVATRQALGGINELSYLIANLLEQLQDSDNSGSGSGGMSTQQMMEQMQQMGENQQQINQQIQDMINDMQGERLRNDQMERLNQLSRQQNQIRKQLQDLRRNGGTKGGDKLGSELERMIEDMEDTINELRGGLVDPTLIERQQNILSRMLEAENALQERDEEEKREGQTGNQIRRQESPEMTLEELEKEIRNRLNDPDFSKYSNDYQRLIEKYFELLRQLNQIDS